jgi:hypothetical protein
MKTMSENSRAFLLLIIQRASLALDAGDRDDAHNIVQEAIGAFTNGERAAAPLEIEIVWNRNDITDHVMQCFGIEITDDQGDELLHSIASSLRDRCVERGHEVIDSWIKPEAIARVLIETRSEVECTDEFLIDQFAECAGDVELGPGVGSGDPAQLRKVIDLLRPATCARFGVPE